MRNTIVRATLLAISLAMPLASSGALGADLPRSSPYIASVPVAGYNWAGPYIGANLGYQWGEVTNNPTRPDGLVGGIQGGYNWQYGQFVFGGEADLQISAADDTFAPSKFSNPWFGTVRGRAGIAFNNILFYGTAGLAYGNVRGEIPGLSENKTPLGWTAGLGAEVGFAPNWSGKIEYLYVDLNDRAFSITGVNNGLESSILRLGVNYHF